MHKIKENNGDRSCADHGEEDRIHKGSSGAFVIACAVSLADKHGVARGHTVGKAHDEEHDGACRADGRKSLGAHKASDNDGINHIVELLKNKA